MGIQVRLQSNTYTIDRDECVQTQPNALPCTVQCCIDQRHISTRAPSPGSCRHPLVVMQPHTPWGMWLRSGMHDQCPAKRGAYAAAGDAWGLPVPCRQPRTATALHGADVRGSLQAACDRHRVGGRGGRRGRQHHDMIHNAPHGVLHQKDPATPMIETVHWASSQKTYLPPLPTTCGGGL